jgi:hypothetical protein
LGAFAAAAAFLTVAACDVESIVELDNPDLITPEVVADTANLPTLANGVIYEFSRAYGGQASNSASPGMIAYSGLLADEIWHSSTFNTHADIDARTISDQNGSLLDVYTYGQRARNLAERSAERFADSPRANSELHALMINLAAFSYVLFAENFCSGVPFSSTSFGGDVEYGQPLSTEETLNAAIALFDQALTVAQAAGSQVMLNLARVGRARTLQNLGDFSAAAAQAASVPTDFVFDVNFADPPAPQNAVWYFVNSANRLSAATGEGQNGLDYFDRGDDNNTIDPRVPVDSVGVGLGSQVPQYNQGLYPEQSSPLPLATGIEARLIEAEDDLAAGASGAYLATLNDLRDDIALPALTDPGTASGRVSQFYDERARWLWFTSHRLGDLRRMIREYGFNSEDIFPVGQTVFGDPYGTDISLPVPFDERNNPNYSGACLAP